MVGFPTTKKPNRVVSLLVFTRETGGLCFFWIWEPGKDEDWLLFVLGLVREHYKVPFYSTDQPGTPLDLEGPFGVS